MRAWNQKLVNVGSRVPQELYDWLYAESVARHISMAEVVRDLLRKAMESDKRESDGRDN